MASFNDVLTEDGQRIFALMAKGMRVTFTKVILGDGIMPNGVLESEIHEVINPVITLNINSVVKTDDNKVIIRSAFHNTQPLPFYMREKGVYATTDGTDECLVFYSNNGALAEYVEVAKTQLIEKIIRTVIAFSESDSINVTLKSSAYAAHCIETDAKSINEFIEGPAEGSPASSDTELEPGIEIILTNSDGEKEVYIYSGGNDMDIRNYVRVYGTKPFVIMHENIQADKRVKGSLYLKLDE